ncbi:MAG: hypothetical protein GSR73_04220 [Desulfurococcales archaeon]|nr:hypothetical protein [Desulfurococcales archaeon]
MRVRVIAADSMGVRSLATVVEVSGVVIGLDLGASIAPRRYGLPPHETEWKALERALDEARRWIRESHIITVTHYHYDHYMRDEPDLYRGKILAVKDPKRNINRSQAIRSYVFLKKLGVEELADVRIADGQLLEFEGVRIEFSPPVWHGEPGTRVGRLVMVRILSEEGTVVFTSDVQGPADPEALRILEEWSRPRPDIVVVGGPPTYFAGFKVPVRAVEAGLAGLKRLITLLRPRVVVVDHHLLRDINYSEKIAEHYEAARDAGVRLVTAAEFMGRPVNQLEARRRELWRGSSG